MRKGQRVSRRSFLRTGVIAGGAAVAAPLILPACAHTKAGRVLPNERVNIAYIGVGRRGCQLMGLPPDAQIVAISDVNAPRMAEVAKKKDWRTYQDYREMLECADIDGVIVASPDHWHAKNTIDACKAGKDVYVEKPMTLTISEGRSMVDAARKHGCVVQVGSQQRSMKECRFGCELVRNGRLGAIHTVHADNYPSPWDCDLGGAPVPDGLDWDMWCGQTEPRPYHPDLYAPRVRGQEAGWISFRPYSGGEMTGWGAHGLDIIQWALGMDGSGPVEIWPELDKVPQGNKAHKGPLCEVCMRYANGVLVKLDAKGPSGGGVFEGEKGSILIDRGKYQVKPSGLDGPLTDSEVRLYESNDHMANWIACIRSRELPIADVEIGHRTTTMCHLGNIARWVKRPLTWDPVKERFPDDAEANRYLARPMRKPYHI